MKQHWKYVICYTFFMKKIFVLLGIAMIAYFSFGYFKRASSPTVGNNNTYKSTDLGISFTYPKILSASTTPQMITLHHQVPFSHVDYCDFKGDGTQKIPTLTDFHVSFHVSNKNLAETVKQESPYIPEENFVNGNVVPSPGFIDPVKTDNLSGFKIFEGAEGCGHVIYYLSGGSNKTLVIIRDWITVFSGVIDTENMAAAEAVPGVLNKAKEEEIFNSILNSLSLN